MKEIKQIDNISKSNHQEILSFARAHGLSSIDELSSFPKYVQIETSALCNAHCDICPIKELERYDQTFIMKQELFDKIAADLSLFTEWIEKLTIQGEGEPLLDQDLEKRIRLLKDIGIKSVAFASNASLLHKERTEAIIHCGVDEVTFSVDGVTAKTFEAMRRPLKFDLCISNIESFIAARNNINPNLRIRIRATLQETNAAEFDGLVSFWRKRLTADDCVYGRLWHSWGNWLKSYSLPAEQDSILLNARPCTSSFSTIFILSDGRVPLCCQDFNGKIPLGNTKHSNIQQIWQSNRIREIRRLHLLKGRNSLDICKDCNLWDPATKKEDKNNET